MSKSKQPKQPDSSEERYSPEETMERMSRALRGAKVAGPKPLKEKPRIRSARRVADHK